MMKYLEFTPTPMMLKISQESRSLLILALEDTPKPSKQVQVQLPFIRILLTNMDTKVEVA